MTSVALPAHAETLRTRLRADSLCFWRVDGEGVAHPMVCLPRGWVGNSFVLPDLPGAMKLHRDAASIAAQLPFALRARLRSQPIGALAVGHLALPTGEEVGVYVAWARGDDVPSEMQDDIETLHKLLEPFMAQPIIDVELALSMRVRDIADSLPHGVVLMDDDVHQAFVNPIAGRLLGVAPGVLSTSALAAGLEELVKRSINRAEIEDRTRQILDGCGPKQAHAAVWRFAEAPMALRVTFSSVRSARQQGWIWLFEDVSTEVALHDRVAREERKFHALYNSLSDAIVRYDLKGNVLEHSAAYGQLLGQPLPASALSRHVEDDARVALDWSTLVGHCLTTERFGPYEAEYVFQDGRKLQLESSAMLHAEADGAAAGIWEVFHDVTRKRQADAELILAAEAFGRHSDGVLLMDAHRVILTVNDALCVMSGYSRAELRGRGVDILQSGRHPAKFYAGIGRELDRRGWWQGGIWSRAKDGEPFFKWVTINAVRNEAVAITHYVAVVREVEAVREARSRIEHLATHDELTGLPNRTFFEEQLDATIRRVGSSGPIIGVLLVDLIAFKNINTALGVSAGDQLLRAVAERLRGLVPSNQVVARLGADRFAVMAPVASASDLAKQCTLVHEGLVRPYALASNPNTVVPASMGVCVFPEDGRGAAELMVRAEVALYRAKQHEVPQEHYFTKDIVEQVRERFLMENGLRRAIGENEFSMVYQPKIDARSGRVRGCEALLRWAPDGKPCSPATFIPVAERSGMIIDITLWVLRQVCRDLCAIDARGLGLDAVSVNISAVHFQRCDMVSALVDIVHSHGLAPCRICLEITEGALVDKELSENKLADLKRLGFTLSIDDFGTGYSSLAYLRRLPVDELKIDRSFIEAIESEEDGRAVVAAAIAMGHALRMKVVAEGVETSTQCDVLRQQDCDLLQGYALGRPMALHELQTFLANNVGRT